MMFTTPAHSANAIAEGQLRGPPKPEPGQDRRHEQPARACARFGGHHTTAAWKAVNRQQRDTERRQHDGHQAGELCAAEAVDRVAEEHADRQRHRRQREGQIKRVLEQRSTGEIGRPDQHAGDQVVVARETPERGLARASGHAMAQRRHEHQDRNGQHPHRRQPHVWVRVVLLVVPLSEQHSLIDGMKNQNSPPLATDTTPSSSVTSAAPAAAGHQSASTRPAAARVVTA